MTIGKVKIPAKYADRIEEIEDDREEDNGWWIYLKDGWVCETSSSCHTIHEDTITQCLKCLRQSRPEIGKENF
jgi:hypothetical protein